MTDCLPTYRHRPLISPFRQEQVFVAGDLDNEQGLSQKALNALHILLKAAIQTAASLTVHGRWRDPLAPKSTRVGLNLSFANDCDPEGRYLTDRSQDGRFTEVGLRSIGYGGALETDCYAGTSSCGTMVACVN